MSMFYLNPVLQTVRLGDLAWQALKLFANRNEK